ncbi:putative WRKY transcription factor [Trichinella spiralis]|uniref:WRKY transcription factor n=1 Tax=Trichinella spiralis TaxID=6334 RepID=A0ABR3KAF9_TRISP
MRPSPEKLPTVQKYSSGHAVQMSSGRDRSNLYAKVKLAAGAAVIGLLTRLSVAATLLPINNNKVTTDEQLRVKKEKPKRQPHHQIAPWELNAQWSALGRPLHRCTLHYFTVVI